MNTRLNRSLLAAVLLAAPGCSEVEMDTPTPDGSVDVPDTTPPQVVSSAPAAAATGVAADAKILITFSEQMDPATVEAAYMSSDLPLDKVELSWNPGGTVLTITPAEELEYESGLGTDPSIVTAKPYAISIGTGAKDLAGNPLQAHLDLAFTTKKRMLASFALVPSLTAIIRDTTVVAQVNSMWIGDNATNETYRSFLTFDIAALPANSEIEAAEISARQTAPSGVPYNIGPVVAQHLTFGTLAAAPSSPTISLPGMFSDDAVLVTKRVPITSQLTDDLANRVARSNRSQYRLQMDAGTDDDSGIDIAVFDKTTFSLLALYLVP